MTPRSPTPRILLLQARLQSDPMAAHEHECFMRHTGLPRDHIECHDLCEGPPSPARLRRSDALMVGGAGDFSVSQRNLPHLTRFLDFLRDVVDDGYPMFASCFGYQCLVEALGGEIVYDPGNTEVGTYEIELTDAGAADPLFADLPRRLHVQMGHKDRAERHPEGIPNLASSERSKYQALRVPDKSIWATQFHPELDRATNLERYQHYLEGYSIALAPEERDAEFAGFLESPETPLLMPRFLSLVFGWRPGRSANG